MDSINRGTQGQGGRFQISQSVEKMTGETPEVRSDKRLPREDRQNQRYQRYHRKRERKEREKREKERLSICIQFSKRKTKYIGRNARNLKKWPAAAADVV